MKLEQVMLNICLFHGIFRLSQKIKVDSKIGSFYDSVLLTYLKIVTSEVIKHTKLKKTWLSIVTKTATDNVFCVCFFLVANYFFKEVKSVWKISCTVRKSIWFPWGVYWLSKPPVPIWNNKLPRTLWLILRVRCSIVQLCNMDVGGYHYWLIM